MNDQQGTDPLATCRGCGARILWAGTDRGRRMPVDRGTSEDGNVQLIRSPEGITAHVLGQADAHSARSRGTQLHVAHWVTCPNPPARKARGRGRKR